NALIVADTGKIVGEPIGAIADYLAMLTLAQASTSADCGELPSILDRTQPSCPADRKPQSLTIADKAYLEGLYQMDEFSFGPHQRSTIARHMLGALAPHG